MTSWRDIAEAPKDGTPILVYRWIEPWDVIGTARWIDIRGIAGWLAYGVADPPGNLGLGAPTHWMPLPYPPQKETL